MYQEMDENGQYQLDCRLDAERNLDENISVVIEFAHKQLEHSVGENFVKSRHEGYGLLSERFAGLARSLKEVNNGMAFLLKTLSMGDSKAIDAVASIDNSLAEMVSEAVQMAAEARRINNDLYHNASLETTPLEDYMSENDGFDEVYDGAPDASPGDSEKSQSLDGTDDSTGGTDAGSGDSDEL